MPQFFEFIRLDRETAGIILLTLRMTISSSVISTILGTLLGLLLEKAWFPGKRLVVRVNRTLMATPPVVAGLVVYLLLMRKGPLGSLQLLFTPGAMIIAQVLIITPIICGMVYSYSSVNGAQIREFAKTMGATGIQTELLLIKEMSGEVYFAFITGFGRAMSEVGAVMIVGGNIQYKTRTMTTAISLMRSKGDYGEAVTLGIILLLIAFVIQLLADFLRKGDAVRENF